MEKTLLVEGMMCPHCEQHVKKALEALDGVTEAIPSHQAGNVLIRMTDDISEETLAGAITNAGYKVR